MNSGLLPLKPDHRDFDFAKSFGVLPLYDFPPEYNVDAGLWNPNQNSMALPMGCTGFSQADLCADEDGTIYDPKDLYENTPPGGEGGRDIRQSLKVTISRGVKRYLSTDAPSNNRTAYFNIRATPPLDAFDAVRLAMYSTKDEKRGVSVGTPYFPEFLTPDEKGRLPMPADFSLSRASWHNWAVKGWRVVEDQTYLVSKDWTGQFKLVSRPLFNRLMAIPGSAAFTLSKVKPGTIQVIDMTWFQTLMSIIRNLLKV